MYDKILSEMLIIMAKLQGSLNIFVMSYPKYWNIKNI